MSVWPEYNLSAHDPLTDVYEHAKEYSDYVVKVIKQLNICKLLKNIPHSWGSFRG
jgi:hypothetical protein